MTKSEINEMCICTFEERLCKLKEQFSKHVFLTKDIRKYFSCVINLFVQSDQNILWLKNEENLIELSSDVG